MVSAMQRIREWYKVPAKRGARVKFRGQWGVITGTPKDGGDASEHQARQRHPNSASPPNLGDGLQPRGAPMTTRDEAIAGTAELAALMTLPIRNPEADLIDQPGVYDMASDAYHRDPVRGGSLSSTGIRKLLEPAGPAKYHYKQTHPSEDHSDNFDFGKAAHQLVLNDPDLRMVVVEADNWLTKAAKTMRDEARAAGLTPILAKDAEKIEAMAAAILAHPVAADLLKASSGKPEQTLVWQDDTSGLWLRARVDWLRHANGSRMIVVDYKTARAADPDSFGRAAADYGYHVQAAFYGAGIKALGLDDDPQFVFVVQEKEAPYLVNVVELDETAMILGRNLMHNALNIYAECVKTGNWYGYPDVIGQVSLPSWYLFQHDETPEMEIPE